MATNSNGQLPGWLQSSENYHPGTDRDGFIARSLLSVTSVLARLRLDDGQETRLSPSAPVKLVFGLTCIVLTSLSGNYAFVLAMLASVLARMALLPTKALGRVVSTSFLAGALTALVMLPAILIGQAHSALLVGTKVLVSVGISTTVALSMPLRRLTGALRTLCVPNLAILTIDLTLRSIATLGTTARKTLQALQLRSVGCNGNKRSSMGGVAGTTLLRANRTAQDTFDAMRCRGFEGSYNVERHNQLRCADSIWALALLAILLLFFHLEEALA